MKDANITQQENLSKAWLMKRSGSPFVFFYLVFLGFSSFSLLPTFSADNDSLLPQKFYFNQILITLI